MILSSRDNSVLSAWDLVFIFFQITMLWRFWNHKFHEESSYLTYIQHFGLTKQYFQLFLVKFFTSLICSNTSNFSTKFLECGPIRCFKMIQKWCGFANCDYKVFGIFVVNCNNIIFFLKVTSFNVIKQTPQSLYSWCIICSWFLSRNIL